MNWMSTNLRGSPEDSRFARLPCRDSGEWNRVERPFMKLATSTRVLQSGQKQYNPLNPTERAKWCIAPLCSDLFQSIRLQVTSIWERTFVRLCSKKEMLWRLIERRHSTEEGQERLYNNDCRAHIQVQRKRKIFWCLFQTHRGGGYDIDIGNMPAGDQQGSPMFAQW